MVTLTDIADVHLSSDSEGEELVDKKSKKKQHKKLIEDIDAISGGVSKKRSKKTKRNEPSQEVSEFSWSTGQDANKKVGLSDLVGCLETSTQKMASIKKKLRTMEKTTEVLEKPLHKPEQQRVERAVAFEETSKEVSKWNGTVQKNREAEQLSFPLQQYKPAKPTITSMTANFKPQNDLEREINEILKGSQHLLERKGKELTAHEEEALKNFDLQEAMERRKELQKIRALQSYYEAKCRRQKKIKSKKYHRILKKEKQKALGKVDLETLSKENPELFQDQLDKAEKMRAEERANLRHRNTSKWAKNLITKGKPNKEDQERIREQLRISRELTNHKAASDSEEEMDDEGNGVGVDESANLHLLTADQGGSENPWLLGNKKKGVGDDEEMEDSGKLKRLEAIVTKESKQNLRSQGIEYEDDAEKSSGEEWEDKEEEIEEPKEIKKSKKRKQKKMEERRDPAEIIHKINMALNETETEKPKKEKKKKQQDIQSDGMRFLKSDSDAVNIDDIDDDDDDDDFDGLTEQRMNIRDAFANDDVIEDFIQEKESVIEKSKPKSTDLTLPGWGEWAGAGLKVSEKKRKRFTKDSGPQKKRRDEGKSNVIISEERNKKLAQHQVSAVPFPYSNREEFERSIRQPIGDLWNTPSVHEKLIEPRITTNAGSIIEPIKASRKMKKKKIKRTENK